MRSDLTMRRKGKRKATEKRYRFKGSTTTTTLARDRLGDLIVAGDATEDTMQAHLATFTQIETLMTLAGQTVHSAYFGTDFCAVAIRTRLSRAKLAGLLVDKAQLTANVDAAFTQLKHTLDIAELLINASEEQEPTSAPKATNHAV